MRWAIIASIYAVLCNNFCVARYVTPLETRIGKAPSVLTPPKITMREPAGPALTSVQWIAVFELVFKEAVVDWGWQLSIVRK